MSELDLLKKLPVIFIIIVPTLFIMLISTLIIGIRGNDLKDVDNLKNVNDFSVPFEDNVVYTITSNYGRRTDPINENSKFHSGIDVSASKGTNIVASASGKVIEVGYSKSGLGCYVYVEHYINNEKYITAYGHMLEDSIVVTKGQVLNKKDKIGIIGSTGRSTGIHLHFMIMKGKISFKEQDLLDPKFVFEK